MAIKRKKTHFLASGLVCYGSFGRNYVTAIGGHRKMGISAPIHAKRGTHSIW